MCTGTAAGALPPRRRSIPKDTEVAIGPGCTALDSESGAADRREQIVGVSVTGMRAFRDTVANVVIVRQQVVDDGKDRIADDRSSRSGSETETDRGEIRSSEPSSGRGPQATRPT
jgi:hypothetical protein